jgi:hypothetical protein
MIAQIAVVTAIIATAGALFSYMGGTTQANADFDLASGPPGFQGRSGFLRSARRSH